MDKYLYGIRYMGFSSLTTWHLHVIWYFTTTTHGTYLFNSNFNSIVTSSTKSHHLIKLILTYKSQSKKFYFEHKDDEKWPTLCIRHYQFTILCEITGLCFRVSDRFATSFSDNDLALKRLPFIIWINDGICKTCQIMMRSPADGTSILTHLLLDKMTGI